MLVGPYVAKLLDDILLVFSLIKGFPVLRFELVADLGRHLSVAGGQAEAVGLDARNSAADKTVEHHFGRETLATAKAAVVFLLTDQLTDRDLITRHRRYGFITLREIGRICVAGRRIKEDKAADHQDGKNEKHEVTRFLETVEKL